MDGDKMITAATVHQIHKVLRSCFRQAVKWEMMDKNPAIDATLPKYKAEEREIWTAEMLMLHSLQRPDVLSFGDLAVQRGLRMLYHHRKITRPLFEKYRRRYSPYGSVACIYLWAVSAGAVEGLKDYAPKEKNDGRKRKNKGDSRP